ncbi:MAG: alanine racemase [Candidatus Thiodiazotropha sp. (ex Ctena orbiculata)]|nr:alanine racemase [Candidatus Thiodiazotropha taylori]
MEFAPQASIDHAALRHNLRVARKAADTSRIWAVIKADGYGHGLLRVAEALQEADGLAVARLDEALALRQQGVVRPLLVLSACISRSDFEQAIAADLQVVVHHRDQLAVLASLSSTSQRLSVWLKLDSGMHRLGFTPDELEQSLAQLKALPVVADINLMSHLANGDDPEDPLTATQCEQLMQIDPSPYKARSLANSAGLLANPATHLDWVRPGIMLYGASPFINTTAAELGLQPVMTLSSRVIAVKSCQAGDAIGYGGSYVCPEAMPVAVVAIGYGDGYPRHAPNGTPVLVDGIRLPLVGRVSMDMLCVDARAQSRIKVGDEVVLWGEGLPVEEIARQAGSIAYELLCGVKRRVRFHDLNRQQREA